MALVFCTRELGQGGEMTKVSNKPETSEVHENVRKIRDFRFLR